MEVLKHVSTEGFKLSDYRKFVLAADFGGTHLNLAVFGISDDYHKLFSTRWHTNEFKDPINIINETLRTVHETYGISIGDAVFAAAGPVISDRKQVKLTNADFLVDINQIFSGTMLNRVALLNDLEALGYGISVLEPGQVEQLQGSVFIRGTSLVIAVGTGLGSCINIIDPISKRELVIATEAGHTNFDVFNEKDLKLAEFIRKLTGNVEYEHVISGNGLVKTYTFLKNIPSSRQKEIMNTDEKAAVISRCALSNNDARCLESIKLLFYYLGRFASELSILSLAKNIYLGGGVVTHNLPLLKESFLQGFLENKKWEEQLASVNIYALKNYDSNLYGCVNVALNYMEELGFKK